MSTPLPWTPNPALYVSPEMIGELALGMDPPLDVAARYGYEPSEFGVLQAQQWFVDAIYRKREELTANGVTFQTKARMMAEEIYTDLFKAAKNGQLTHALQVETAKQLTDIAGVRKSGGDAPAGPAFAITINLPDNPQAPSLHVAERKLAEKPAPLVIDMTPLPPMPPKPEGFKVADFNMNRDLTAGT